LDTTLDVRRPHEEQPEGVAKDVAFEIVEIDHRSTEGEVAEDGKGVGVDVPDEVVGSARKSTE
jgi:hypothetical protein